MEMRTGAKRIAAGHLLAAVREMRDRTWLEKGQSIEGSVAVVSTERGEGRTTVALAMAIALAELGGAKAVLLVDGDLDKPELAGRLGLQPAPGLAEVLQGQASLASVAQGTHLQGLAFLPAGAAPQRFSGLLAAPGFGGFLQHARQSYRSVVLDTPALSRSSSGLLVASQADRSILVVEANRTLRHQAQAAQSRLEAAQAKVLGVVLNRYREFLPRRYRSGG